MGVVQAMDGSYEGKELLKHAAWIRALARSLVADAATAEDLVQDTWVAALKHRPSTDRSLRPWLGRVLHNFARQHFRRQDRRQGHEQQAPERGALVTPAELTERLDSERLLTEELARLEEPLRSTLWWRFYEGLQPIEIARRQGLPAGTVRWRLKRGLDLLRTRLDERHGGDRRAWSALLIPLARSPEILSLGASSAATMTGVLAMNLALKVGVAAVLVVVVTLGLKVSGLMPALLPWIEAEEPVDVAFRPLPEESAPEVTPALEGAPRAPERTALAEASTSEVQVEEPLPSEVQAVSAVVATIVDVTGNPLAGIGLRELTEEGPGQPALSRADGSVELALEIEESEQRVRLEAYASGFASHGERLRISSGETVNLGTIVLEPGGAASGRVIDAQGAGIPGARVTFGEFNLPKRELESLRFEGSPASVPETRSDANGDFLLCGLADGYVRLWARAEGQLTGYTAPVEVRVGEESMGVEITLADLAAKNLIRGLVLDPSGQPVPHAHLDYRHESKQGGSTRVTTSDDGRADADGTFEFVLLEKSRLWITAEDPDERWAPASAAAVETGEVGLVLQLGDVRSTELRVSGEDGLGVQRFAFEVLSPDESLVHQDSSARKRAGGRAKLRIPDQAFVVRVTAPLFETETLGPLDPERVGDVLEVSLRSLPGLSGRVFAGEQPLAGARVRLHRMVAEDVLYVKNGFRCRIENDVTDEAESDAEGRFLLTVRASGDYLLRAEAHGYAPTEWGPVNLGTAVATEGVELFLSAGGALEGRVVLAGGADPTGSIVGVSRGDGQARTRRVGPDGGYRFEGLMPGPWLVSLREEEVFAGHTSISTSTQSEPPPSFDDIEWSCRVYEGETTTFDLRPDERQAHVLSGRLQVTGGGAWSAALIPAGKFFGEGGNETALDPSGRFELSMAEPGEYQLILRGIFEESGEQYLIDTVSLSGSRTQWEYELETAALTVENLEPWDGDGAPHLVHFWEGARELMCITLLEPDADGICRLEAVPIGAGKLVRPNRSSLDPRSWEVALALTVSVGRETRVSAP